MIDSVSAFQMFMSSGLISPDLLHADTGRDRCFGTERGLACETKQGVRAG